MVAGHETAVSNTVFCQADADQLVIENVYLQGQDLLAPMPMSSDSRRTQFNATMS